MDITLTTESAGRATTVRLFKDQSSPTSYKEFICAVSTAGRDFRRTMTSEEVQGLLKALQSARISPVITGEVGLDGTTFELVIEDWSSHASYRWSGTPREGWHELMVVADQLLKLASQISGRYVP